MFEFDETAWPLVRLRFPKKFTHGEFLDHCERIRGFMRRGEPFAIVTDARGSTGPNALQRQTMIEILNEPRARHMLGAAIVVNSPALAAVLTALNMFKQHPIPARNFTNALEAEAWAQDLIDVRLGRKKSA